MITLIHQYNKNWRKKHIIYKSLFLNPIISLTQINIWSYLYQINIHIHILFDKIINDDFTGAFIVHWICSFCYSLISLCHSHLKIKKTMPKHWHLLETKAFATRRLQSIKSSWISLSFQFSWGKFVVVAVRVVVFAFLSLVVVVQFVSYNSTFSFDSVPFHGRDSWAIMSLADVLHLLIIIFGLFILWYVLIWSVLFLFSFYW